MTLCYHSLDRQMHSRILFLADLYFPSQVNSEFPILFHSVSRGSGKIIHRIYRHRKDFLIQPIHMKWMTRESRSGSRSGL